MIPQEKQNPVTLFALASTNGSNGAGVSITNYVGQAIAVLEVHNNAANATSLDFAIQTSTDNSTGWANVATNAAFTTVTDAIAARGTLAQYRTFDTRLCNQYVRLAATATNSNPNVTIGATLLMVPQAAS